MVLTGVAGGSRHLAERPHQGLHRALGLDGHRGRTQRRLILVPSLGNNEGKRNLPFCQSFILFVSSDEVPPVDHIRPGHGQEIDALGATRPRHSVHAYEVDSNRQFFPTKIALYLYALNLGSF